MVLQLCNINKAVGTWDQELAWAVSKHKGKSLIVVGLRLHIFIQFSVRGMRVLGKEINDWGMKMG
ncbi:DNA ligase [Gossypium australe]|uniref:DNA ligase n=1 Tax=Gossypium australe TaxID=47621 RepID=A0A5B6WXW9_9ROSI|nr:DNA ligase [Gossypium australe]